MSDGAVFSGAAEVSVYQAIVIKNALLFYAKTGMKVNRAYTPSAMLAAASAITGQRFKRGQYKEAAAAIEVVLEETRRASGNIQK